MSKTKYVIYNPEKKSYWLPKGLGYTKKKEEAGQFTLSEMEVENFNLDNQILKKRDEYDAR